MKSKNRLLIFTILISILLSAAVAYAEEPINRDAIGSIAISLGENISDDLSDGKIVIIKIADIDFDNNCYNYVKELSECDVDLGLLNDSSFPAKIESYVNSKSVVGKEYAINKDGKVNIENLELGLYLIKQTVPCKGYLPFNTFVVSIPGKRFGKYEYDIDSKPKMDEIIKDESTPDNPPIVTIPPTASPSPTPTGTEDNPNVPTNPTTGDNSNLLLWLALIMLSGVIFFRTIGEEK